MRPWSPIHRYDPNATPAWRWELSGVLVRRPRISSREEPTVLAAVRYRRLLQTKNSDAARRALPDLAAAHDLHQDDSPRRWEIQARLLTDQSIQPIATAVGLAPSVLRIYETLFFNVRRGGAVPHDWIIARVIAPLARVGGSDELMAWLWAALACGVPVLDLLIGDYHHRPEPPMSDRHAIAQGIRWMARDSLIHAQPGIDDTSILEILRLAELRPSLAQRIAADPILALHVRFLKLAAEEVPTNYAAAGRRGNRASTTSALGVLAPQGPLSSFHPDA